MKKIIKEQYRCVTRYVFRSPVVGRYFMPASCYYVDGTLFDTGQARNRKTVGCLIDRLKIDQVLLTHHHEDHSGNAAEIKRRKQVPVYGHCEAVKIMKSGFGIKPYQHIMWGASEKTLVEPVPSTIQTERYLFRPVHTPGHSLDHLVYLEASEGWLFSGDLFLAPRIKYCRSDERILQTIRSLRKVLLLDFDALFCSHNPRIFDGKAWLKRKLDFLEGLRGEIQDMAAKGYDVKHIVQSLTGSETLSVKMFTLGDVSYANIVRSILNDTNQAS